MFGHTITRREIILLVVISLLFGLFLQFDLSLRFTDASGSDSLLGVKLGFGRTSRDEWYDGRSDRAGDRWLDDAVEAGVKSFAGDRMAGMTETKLHWTVSGPPITEVLAHAPGWTIFDQVYLFKGTWYIVTDNPSSIPLLRLMTSTGNEIWNEVESIQGREPTEKDMRIIFPSEAKRLWGQSASRVSGTSFLVNDPPQFLDHYYHFAAELLVGLWRTYSSLDPTISAAGTTHLPTPSRMILPHVEAGTWNDYAKMNSFLSRAIFPSMSYEYRTDFVDRADTARAFLFDRVLFADRAAAFRGDQFLSTWRTTSEAMTLQASEYWWIPVQKNLLAFVGTKNGEVEIPRGKAPKEGGMISEHEVLSLEDEEGVLEVEEALDRDAHRKVKQTYSGTPVITYVSRQEWGRRMLRHQDHVELVSQLNELQTKYGWEVNVVSMDQLSRDEQIRLAARTTVMLGVHGNGLTHLLWMDAQNPRSTIIEIFYPGGFASDYQFTARSIGIRHYGVWDDQVFTDPDTPQIAYPEGFQGNEIPINGKAVAELVVERLLVQEAPSADV